MAILKIDEVASEGGPTELSVEGEIDLDTVAILRGKLEELKERGVSRLILDFSSTRYVNSSAPTNTARAHTLTAATFLYGNCSAEYKAVQAAWTSVNVAGSDAACPVGNDFSLAASPASGSTKDIMIRHRSPYSAVSLSFRPR